MDQQPTPPMGPFEPQSGPKQGSGSRRAKVAGTVAAVGLIGALAAGGVAWAGGALGSGGQGGNQTNDAAPAALTGPETPAPTDAPKPGEHVKRGMPGRFGMGMGLHGEFVVKQSDGSGYQTVATQVGKVTAVSSSSITLKSEDGYSRTYTVTADTLVNSTRDGISAVKKDDEVRVFATVADEKATAVQVADVTGRKDAIEKWGFGRHR
ncbi:hypothetical protein [Flindersiella endophytica]